MTALRVCFAARADWLSRPGGDSVQIEQTARALRELGVEITVTPEPDIDLSGFDIVHLFHLGRVHESYPHFANARRQDKPVVVSTIYWPRLKGWRRTFMENARNMARSVRAQTPTSRRGALTTARIGYRRCLNRIASGSQMLLPNSQAELDLLANEFGRDQKIPARIIPNAVDTQACERALATFPARRRRVLCVGHFDPRKNQLALIEALNGEDVEVCFVGQAREMHRRYYNRCRRRAGDNMRFVGQLEPAEVLREMGASSAFVSASHIETPGLAALEAAALGCNLALGDCEPVREYFKDEVIYFDPKNPTAIRRSVQEALGETPQPNLSRRILTQYTWAAAAGRTLEAYHATLA